jgi:hypothetical protein
MLHTLRSRGFALATLGAFLLAQPAALCTALCLIGQHHGATHAMPHTARGNSAVASSTCHTTTAADVQRDAFNILSPMAPSHGPVIAVASPRPAEPVRTRAASLRQIFHTVESPPPRLV